MLRGASRRSKLAAALVIVAGMAARFYPRSAASDVREGPGMPASPGFEAAVQKAFREQASLISRPEHCSADPDRLRAIGRGVGHQVRVSRGESDVAVFTVSEARDEEPEAVVRMGLAARERLRAPQEFPARVLAEVTHPTLTDAEARQSGEFVERSDDDGVDAGLLVLAPHGGQIEPFTDQQAERVAANLAGKPVATWRCMGWAPKGGPSASARWHITSTEIHEASFPRLARLAGRRFAYAVSFHGMGREGILIGGAGPSSLKKELQAEIGRALAGSGIAIEIAAEGDRLGGSDPRNIVNRYCRGTGVQIEQSPRARRDSWRAIADAVARVYASHL